MFIKAPVFIVENIAEAVYLKVCVFMKSSKQQRRSFRIQNLQQRACKYISHKRQQQPAYFPAWAINIEELPFLCSQYDTIFYFDVTRL